MSRDKQIENMARAIHINCHKGLTSSEATMIASTKGTFGSYVECRNPNKVWHHEISKKRQRTMPKCRYYEKAVVEGNENGT